IAAMPIAAAVENRTCRRFILSSLQCPELSCRVSNAMNAPHRVTAVRVLARGERDANCDQWFGGGHVGSESPDRHTTGKTQNQQMFAERVGPPHRPPRRSTFQLPFAALH